MSEFEFPDLPWDDGIDEVVETGPRVFSDVGIMQYLGPKQVQLFASGERVTFPNFLVNGEPYSRGGMKEGWKEGAKNATAHFIAFTGTNQQGEEFVTVKIFTTMTNIPVDAGKVEGYPVVKLNDSQQKAKDDGKTVWLADWSNLQFPALVQSLSAKDRNAFSKGQPLYFKGDRWNTGTPPREDAQGRTNDKGEVKKYYDYYWCNIQTFNTKEEMLAARGSVSENGTAVSHYPASWVKSGLDDMLEYVKTNPDLDRSNHKAFAVNIGLLDENGQPAKTSNDKPCDVAKILSEVLNIPEPMIKL